MKTILRLLMLVSLVGVQSGLATEGAVQKLAAANNTFAFNLLKQLAAENRSGNIFVSPYSATTALQMAANGAAGRTKKEMRRALETSALSPSELNAASKAAADLLNSNDTNLVLFAANALWYRQGSRVKAGFLETNQNYFSSTIRPLDFSNAQTAEAEINRWANNQTHGRITGIADGTIDPVYTDLILANVIYFKGKWLDPFEVKLTKERPFHSLTGATNNLPMMEMSERFTYRKGSGYQAVRLPYMGNNFAMYVLLPDPGSTPAKLLHVMNGDNWRRVTIPGFSERDGRLVLPKFKLETTMELNQPLKALGIKTAFQKSNADFSNMFNDSHHISEVRQQAFVEVNEEGTEASAWTMILMNAAGIEPPPPKPFEMIVDRPFLFAIVDARSEMILFLGIVNDL